MHPTVTLLPMLRTTFALGLLLLVGAPGVAQDSVAPSSPTSPLPRMASVPFGLGERAVYRVGYGIFRNVGFGSTEIVSLDMVRGHPTYHMHFRLRGGVPGARVNNTFDSWMDVRGLFSRRFEQDTNEVRFQRRRTREFFPEERRWTGRTNERQESGELPTSTPLDDTSFLFFVRTIDLEEGQEYEFNDYWNPNGNPVRIRVLRRETIEVPAGTFNTIVVQPLIRTSGLFSEGGEAEVYLSDDDARILVMIRARVTFGSLRLELSEYEPGTPLDF
jgi:hypothetical protein